MTGTPLSNPRGRDPLGDSSMATTLAFVFSREFRGWACNNCDWRFPMDDPNLVFTDARADEVMILFDEHRCGDLAKLDGRVHAPSSWVSPMNKTNAIAEWVLPLLLWIAVMGIFVSLVVAAISSAT